MGPAVNQSVWFKPVIELGLEEEGSGNEADLRVLRPEAAERRAEEDHEATLPRQRRQNVGSFGMLGMLGLLQKLVNVHLRVANDLAEEAATDVLTGMDWDHRPPAVGVPKKDVTSSLPDFLKAHGLQCLENAVRG